MQKIKFRYPFSLFLLLLCAVCPNSDLSAASFEKAQSSVTSELKSGSTSGFSGTQPPQSSQQSVTNSVPTDVADLNLRQERSQATISQGSAFPTGQPTTTFNQPKTANFDAKARYADISMKQGIVAADPTFKPGDTTFLKKHPIRSPGDKTPKDNEEVQKYLSYGGEDIADHYKERKEEDVELIYK